jgi:hypothetical protein
MIYGRVDPLPSMILSSTFSLTLLFSVLFSVVHAGFNFTTNQPTECENLEVTWSGALLHLFAL